MAQLKWGGTSPAKPDYILEKLSGMIRTCYKCQKDLKNEPAIRGQHGLLCFPCRYMLDKAGGEAFLASHPNYSVEKKQWEQNYGVRWRKYKRIEKLRDILGYIYGLTVISCLVVLGIAAKAGLWSYSCGWLAAGAIGTILASSVISAIIGEVANKYRSPSPPSEPPNTLNSKPELVFDEKRRIEVETRHFRISDRHMGQKEQAGWQGIRKKCLERDGYVCRICGAKRNLEAHHVVPVSKGGPDCLQNLVILCSVCHEDQEYYDHKLLIQMAKLLGRKHFED